MYKIGVKYTLSAALTGIVINSFAATHPRELTLFALTDPSLSIPRGEVGLIRYKLLNHGSKEVHLTMKPIPGVEQKINENEPCSKPVITLGPGQACTLQLNVSANEAIGIKRGGPLLCEEGTNWYDQDNLATTACVQPPMEERISVREIPIGQASFSVKIERPLSQNKSKAKFVDEHLKRSFASFTDPTFSLFQGSDLRGRLAITNTSTTTPIYKIQAQNLPSGITQDASNCQFLDTGKTCYLIFYPGSIRYSGTSVSISGINTPSFTVTFQVLGIGDPYNGSDQLFQLPSSSNLNLFTAATNDVPGGINNWLVMDAECSGNYRLPPVTQLSELYNASNCVGGPILNFTCTPNYWSSDVTFAEVAVIDFSNGDEYMRVRDLNYYARCVTQYTLSDV